MYASEEPSKWRKIAETSSWVLLFIVVFPGTTLGYFAENSLPNTALYPIKTGIERVILTLSSVNDSAKTAYELELARIRVQETKQLFDSNKPITPKDIEQLNIVAAQLDNTQLAIANVSDPVQKQQLQQQLNQTTQDYKSQLSDLKQHLTSTSQMDRGAITPTVTQFTNTSNQTQNNNQTQNSAQNSNTTQNSNTSQTSDTMTVTNNTDTSNFSSVDNLSNQDAALLQQTIDTVSNQLDTITTAPTPIPTLPPYIIPTDTPIPTPTPTPVPFFFFHHNGDGSHHDSNN